MSSSPCVRRRSARSTRPFARFVSPLSGFLILGGSVCCQRSVSFSATSMASRPTCSRSQPRSRESSGLSATATNQSKSNFWPSGKSRASSTGLRMFDLFSVQAEPVWLSGVRSIRPMPGCPATVRRSAAACEFETSATVHWVSSFGSFPACCRMKAASCGPLARADSGGYCSPSMNLATAAAGTARHTRVSRSAPASGGPRPVSNAVVVARFVAIRPSLGSCVVCTSTPAHESSSFWL